MSNTDMMIKEKIEDMLLELGIPTSLFGHGYLIVAVKLYADNQLSCNPSMTKVVYPTVANVFKTTPSRVERAIRHAIEVSFSRIDSCVVSSYFGGTINKGSGKPTNSEFIATLAMHLKRTTHDDTGETND